MSLIWILLILIFVIYWFRPGGECANCGKERKGRHLKDGGGGEQFCKPNCPVRDLMQREGQE